MFFVGLHQPSDAKNVKRAFISVNRLRGRRSDVNAGGDWIMDSGAFTTIHKPDTFKLGYYAYDFGDGWRAAVSVREITRGAAQKLRQQSRGFCGYDWMIDEIVKHGRIKTLAERTVRHD